MKGFHIAQVIAIVSFLLLGNYIINYKAPVVPSTNVEVVK